MYMVNLLLWWFIAPPDGSRVHHDGTIRWSNPTFHGYFCTLVPHSSPGDKLSSGFHLDKAWLFCILSCSSTNSGFPEWVASVVLNPNQKPTGLDGWGDSIRSVFLGFSTDGHSKSVRYTPVIGSSESGAISEVECPKLKVVRKFCFWPLFDDFLDLENNPKRMYRAPGKMGFFFFTFLGNRD